MMFFSVLGRFALVILGGAFALIVAEYSVRLALPKYDPAGHIAFFVDPATKIQLGKPNSKTRQIKNSGDYDVEVVFNRHGLRDVHDIADGRLEDIYVVGDSFAFGWGVEQNERFSSILEKLTGRRVYNISTTENLDGYERLLAYSAGQGAKLRDVVMAINMIDDVQDYDALPQITTKPSTKLAAEPREAVSLQTVKQFLLTNSALYFLGTSAIGSIDILRRLLVRLGFIKTLNVVAGGIPGRDAISSTAARIWALSKKYNLTVLMIPSRGLWVGDRRKATADAHEEFAKELRRRGLDPVDMRPVMEATGNPMQFHFRHDGHWRPQGHALAAAELVRRLKSGPKQPGTN
jgi:hypothetical protein